MVLSKNLNEHFKQKQPDSLVTAELADKILEKYGLPNEVKEKVREIITGENHLDVENEAVKEAIVDFGREYVDIENKGKKQIDNAIYDIAA